MSNHLRLLHIRDAAKLVVEFTKNANFEDFETNLLLKSAVERQIQIIGEATYNLTKELKQQHTSIEWRKIEGTRHILVHEYDEVFDAVIWSIVTQHIPRLLVDIESIIEATPSNE